MVVWVIVLDEDDEDALEPTDAWFQGIKNPALRNPPFSWSSFVP